jgi:hypothetical protein
MAATGLEDDAREVRTSRRGRVARPAPWRLEAIERRRFRSFRAREHSAARPREIIIIITIALATAVRAKLGAA